MDFGISEYDKAYSETFGFSPDWRDIEDEYPRTLPEPDVSFPDHYDAEFPDHAYHDHAEFSFGIQCVID